MHKSLYQTADAGDTLSDARCRSLYQTEDAGDTLSDSRCRCLSIRQRMKESLYQTVDAGDTLSHSECRILSDSGYGDTLSMMRQEELREEYCRPVAKSKIKQEQSREELH